MNKVQKEMLEKCVNANTLDLEKIPLFDYIYMLPTNKKHDSGYKLMYVIGCVVDLKTKKEKLYLLDQYCDILNFGNYLSENHPIKIDVIENNIIRFFNNAYKFKCTYNCSHCCFDMIKCK